MITVKHTFKLYDVINRHFDNEEDSRTFISEIEEIMDNKVDLKMNDFSTKSDLSALQMAVKQDIAELRTEVKQDIAEIKADVSLSLANSATNFEISQKEQLRWLIGIMIAALSLMAALSKLT